VNPAVQQLERAVRLQDHADHRVWLGRGYGAQALRANVVRQALLARRALGEFERAVALDPDHLDARSSMVDFHLAAPTALGGSRARALEQAQAARQRSAYVGGSLLARVHFASGDAAASERELRSLVRAFPDSIAPRMALAAQHAAAREWDRALELYEELARRDPPVWNALYQVGRVGALSGSHLDRAEAALRAYLARPPAAHEIPHHAAYWRLGMVQEHRGDVAGARRSYQEALRLEPGHRPSQDALRKLRE
jgi:tetratricopeptide (TPR) repeat protein